MRIFQCGFLRILARFKLKNAILRILCVKNYDLSKYFWTFPEALRGSASCKANERGTL